MTGECGTTGLYSACAELWEAEIDMEDIEAEEDIIVHFDNGKPLFKEILKASKIFSLMVQGLAEKEVNAT